MNIDLSLITKAIDFYGYSQAKVPYLVDPDIMDWTCPQGVRDKRLTHTDGKQYVASAEQSFLQLEKDGKLSLNDEPMLALTPCYRDEEVLDDTHLNVFLKLEIFEYNPVDEVTDLYLAKRMQNFFDHEGLITKIIKTDIGYDVVTKDNLELGSFGYRTTPKGVSYVYGTGLAEPRASLAIEESLNKSY